MKKVQRLGGKMMKRSADQQDVGAVIAEFKATDDMLDRLLKDLKIWRDGWDDILKLQYDTSEALAALYKPIDPVSDPEQRRTPAQTPQQYLQKCLALQKMYSDQKSDLAQEVGMISTKLLRPVDEAKQCMKALHKTLKHRENMKLDYERYVSRAEHARKKATKTPKEEAALAKCENDLQQASIDYNTADDQVKQTFPPIVDAVSALLPYLLASQVMLQTTLVGQLYTSLDAFCRQQRFPSPAPSDAEIVRAWEEEHTSFRKELESGISVIAGGKAVHLPMNVPEPEGSTITGLGIRNKGMAYGKAVHQPKHHPDQEGSTVTGLGIRNKGMGLVNRTKGGQSMPQRPAAVGRNDSPHAEEEETAPPKPPRWGATPGQASPAVSPGPGIPMSSKPRMPFHGNTSNTAPYAQKATSLMPSPAAYPTHQPPPYSESAISSTPPSKHQTPANGLSPNPSAHPGNDYFARETLRRASSNSLASSAASAAAAAKKKPPPPVPTKRLASQQTQFVTALYDFEGQTSSDLVFREGDRIRVVKRTESVDDWWEGECGGRKGSFPANYVQL